MLANYVKSKLNAILFRAPRGIQLYEFAQENITPRVACMSQLVATRTTSLQKGAETCIN
jgi:hypothetical protein